MSAPIEPPPPPPPPAPPAAPGAVVPQQPNGLGVVALVLGIVALVLAFVPFASYGAGLPAIVALVLGIVAVARAGNRRRRAGVAGLVLGILALIMAIVMSVVYTAVFFLSTVAHQAGLPDIGSLASELPSGFPTDLPSDFPTDLPSGGSLASAPASGSGGSVVFAVTGTGKATTIAYAAIGQAVAGTDQVSDQALPWKKTVGIDSGSEVFTVVVQAAGSDPVTCTISVNGKVLSKETSEGGGIAACSAHSG